MNNKSINIYIPDLPTEISGIRDMALNLWWNWNAIGKKLFKEMDPYLWTYVEHNPIKLLRIIDKQRLNELAKDKKFIKLYKLAYIKFKNYMSKNKIDKELPIAYFCAEFGLHHSLPIYSGGLGFLAGDVLKEASDMNLSMVGIGFLYPFGYVTQDISPDGWQYEVNKEIDKDEAPIMRVLDKEGKHLVIELPFITPKVYVGVWKVNVGKVELFLLDTDVEQNSPLDRQINSKLYTPDINQRLRQQIILGIGGIELLKHLNIDYSALHLNEGHSVFALFERIRYEYEKSNNLQKAIEYVKETSIFTTHTPLMAATDVYDFDMIAQHLGEYWKLLGMDEEKFLSFGINPEKQNGFNTTVCCLNLCKYKNGVSKKHAEVSNKIWEKVVKKDSIIPITNGVHLSTWINDDLNDKYNVLFGEDWKQLQNNIDLWDEIDVIDDEFLWNMKLKQKAKMFNFIKDNIRQKWSNSKRVNEGFKFICEGLLLESDVLTITFARRMTEYKRPTLILKDLERLKKIVSNDERPVQIIFSGLAHPSDIPGKKLIQQIFSIAKDPEFKGRIAFIENYNEFYAKYLVKGSDVWLNTPKPPLEASGTSGMKASMNGTLHLSELDGWWIEGFNGKNGWKIFDKNEDKEAEMLYDLIENELIPKYYNRDENSLPTEWIKMMKEAIKSVSPLFNTKRMMEEYREKFYKPITLRINNV